MGREPAPAGDGMHLVAVLAEMIERPLMIVDDRHRIRHTNGAFTAMLGALPAGTPLSDLDDTQWPVPTLRSLLESAAESGGPASAAVRIGRRRLDVTLRPVSDRGSSHFTLLHFTPRPLARRS